MTSAAETSKDFWREFKELIEKYRCVFGPLTCTEHGNMGRCGEAEEDCWTVEGRIVSEDGTETYMLADMVVMVGFRDIISEKSWSMVAAPYSQARYTTLGLLQCGVEEV